MNLSALLWWFTLRQIFLSLMFVAFRNVARPLLLCSRRPLHLTPSHFSSWKNNEALEKFFEDSPSLKQLTNKPGVVAAMAELAKVLQEQGCCESVWVLWSNTHNRYWPDFGNPSNCQAVDVSDDAVRLLGGYHFYQEGIAPSWCRFGMRGM